MATLVKIARFYFVHAKSVYPKPYLAIVPNDESLRVAVKPGTAWAWGQANQRPWQTIVVVETMDLDWVPPFKALLNLRAINLNGRKRQMWDHFQAGNNVQVTIQRRNWRFATLGRQ